MRSDSQNALFLRGHRWVPLVATYLVSLIVLVLQLLALSGERSLYAIFVIAHLGLFWWLARRFYYSSGGSRLVLLIVGSIVIGSIPFQTTIGVLHAMTEGGEYHFSSATRHLPQSMRVLIEIGFFPIVQLVVLMAGLHVAGTARFRLEK